MAQDQALYRYEFKYLVRAELIEKVSDFLSVHLRLDSYSGSRGGAGYTVRSIYFDSPDLECVQRKLGGEKYRETYRLRTYNRPGSAPLYLERKVRDGLLCRKERMVLSGSQLQALAELSYDGINAATDASKITETLFFRLYRQAYRPAALVSYERQAYFDQHETYLRVTLDRDLRALICPSLNMIYNEDRLERVLGRWAILELKFARALPRWLRWLSVSFQLQRLACSKYCTCAAYLLGERPSLSGGALYV